MNRISRYPAVILLAAILAIAWGPALSLGQGRSSPLVPPQSNAFGKSLEEWSVLQTQFALATGLGGATNVSDTVGRVRLLPGSFFDPAPVFNINLSPGTPFVATPFFLFGERYDDPSVPDDDPDAIADLLAEIFANAQIQVILDGRVVLEGSAADLEQFQFGPVYLDQPVVYAEPQPRGESLNSVAALWVTGIGLVYHPLPVGDHTLVYTVNSDFLGDLVFTYNITVAPR